jgi:uncharacterized phiE125 gp8 family phage protein
MKTVLYTAPTAYPVTLQELKDHLRVDSGTFDGNLTTYQCIVAASQSITDGYALLGTAVEVIGKRAIVNLNSGTNGEDGTVDAKIQESDDNSTWTDWTDGAFTQVTTANDNAIQEKEYTGTKRYIRVAAKVLVAPCVFGVDVIVELATTAEDDDLNDLIKDATAVVENITRRALLTQTWDYYLNDWPEDDFIKLPFGNLASVTSVSWKDTDGTETTLTENTDYLVETNSDGIGRIVLPYSESWPSGTLYPSNPIKIRFVCGWTAAVNLPKNIKRAVKFAAEDAYYRFDRHEALSIAIDSLLASYRLWDEF